MSRSECLLRGDETNWELKDTCHAEAILNYALVNRFCYEPYWPDDTQVLALPRDGVVLRNRTYYWEEDNPTPEQDRFMWKQDLEDDWFRMKCEGLDPKLEFNPDHYPTLVALLESTADPTKKRSKNVRDLLIELGARLGDDAAGLTRRFYREFSRSYNEEGFKYGRFSDVLTGRGWWLFASKREPSAENYVEIFNMLARVESDSVDPRVEIQIDWQYVVRHLCSPPYYKIQPFTGRSLLVENDERLSCKEIVHDIRLQGTTSQALLSALDKFEQVALELEIFE